MEENRLYSVWLSIRPGLTPKKIKSLIETYKTARTIYFLSQSELNDAPLDEIVKQTLRNKNLDHAKHICEECEKKGIDILEYNDDYYPPLLRNLPNPPFVLYKKGRDIDYRRYPIASIVGSRILSDYGKNVTEKISFDMAKQGFIVVSGMALGADAAAHLSALKGGMASVAVLGCGVDEIYPYENRDLYNKLCTYGAVLSEYPPGTKPERYNFPQRNRIVSGMSHLTVVTEARIKSGSLITAEYTNEQGKQVFAVPQNINSPYGTGTNLILKEYARVLTDSSDAYKYYVETYRDGNYTPVLEDAIKKRQTRKYKNPPINKTHKDLPDNLNESEIKILNALRDGPKHINKISNETGYPLGKIRAIATLLEIRGLVYTVEGNAYAMTSKDVWNSGEARL